ncbi:RNA polymerase II transcription mediator complex subunit 9 [Ceratobasidium sp. AG-Ba]|nr:RNA polymerase II transcription mediator complex subunit 9 [Ceratobasidium sp. AG-Ba]QRV87645.1 RNA polymerase II transcription mediator complex subunit 9 [Ceratobasidium sp. AG-Ba]QRW01825.1 RNA polymerase II transcription mediator complex subunit 9 [Ceratobasidium sp. AG-Ba]
MSATPLSQATFEALLPSIVAILQTTQPQPSSNAQTQRQEIAKATLALRSQLAHARDIVDALPGGEMLLEHQHEVIAMLKEMRNARRAQLARLSDLSLGSPGS